jgi:cytosine/adenosine deaminase-related metal-dependent hydrolase
MSKSSETFALRARYLFPVDAPVIADAVITIERGRIVAVGENTSGRPPRDLGNAAILPGLVNAHTHLEFSDLTCPLGRPGMALPVWIAEVIKQRRERDGDAQRAIAVGLHESLAFGTTLIGEIATGTYSADPPLADLPRLIAFRELIGLSKNRIDENITLARQHIEQFALDDARLPGLSPHAPYTVHPQLLQRVVELSSLKQVTLAMHLAESREELQLLRDGDGPLRDLLESLNAWDPSAIPPGTRPLHYLRTLAEAHRALVIHGNYLDDEEIAFMADHADHMAVVYCPRTHEYFQHAPYRLEKLLKAGVTIALGTDSRASNPDLSLLEEMRAVRQRHPDVSSEDILRMGTFWGAKSLGQLNNFGSLQVGKPANLSVVTLPSEEGDPHKLLWDARTAPRETWIDGHIAFAAKPS